jgi:hypothetical protein
MQTKTGMLAGAAAIAMTGSVVLAPAVMADPIPPAASYAELLEPVPDAMARIHADDATAAGDARVIPAQLQVGIGIGHHHHHHHHHSARWYRHHGYYWNGGAWLQGPPPRPHHHHHHHHHHHQQWR